MIKVKDLSLSVSGSDILKNITFTLKDNTSLVISGPSGSGKTKLLETLSGLENSFSGNIEILGRSIIEYGNELYNILGYVGNFGLENNFSENVTYDLVFPLEIQNTPNAEIKIKLDRIVEDYDLGKLLDTSSRDLSTGEKQLVNICTTIIKEPKLLLMDDPMTTIDANKKKILVDKLVTSKKYTTIFASKEIDTFSKFDKILFLDNGGVYYFGDTVTFLKDHRDKLIQSGMIVE